uniref:Ig-like domain-containing protein n=1 Tax=Chelonoidis abingdonii TaxID=106734 RepID=A0A8C0GAB9_CHEAB
MGSNRALLLPLLAPPSAKPGQAWPSGLNGSLPCNLMGPSLSWRWLPRYPRCAGVSAGIQTIYTATAAGAHDTPEGRFQKRLHLLMDQDTQTSVFELQTLHMSDSGTFFCASPSQLAPPISVTVTPGNSTAGGPGARTPGFSPWLWDGEGGVEDFDGGYSLGNCGSLGLIVGGSAGIPGWIGLLWGSWGSQTSSYVRVTAPPKTGVPCVCVLE